MNDTKRVWGILNNIIKRDSLQHSYPDYFIDKNSDNYNMNEIVDSINKFFCECWAGFGRKDPY